MALFVDVLNVFDQATMGRAPSMTLVSMNTILSISGSSTPAHARNGALVPGTNIGSQCDFAVGKLALLFVAKSTIKWTAATPE
ncbi:hypothetical protein XPA_007092 [Xanthoria parietina]